MEPKKEYLGDGVYVWHDGFQFVLEAESGGQMNVIYLEPNAMAALKEYEKILFDRIDNE